MARIKRKDRPVIVRVCIPQSVLSAVDKRLVNPLTETRDYGVRSELITHLLIEWLAKPPAVKGPSTLEEILSPVVQVQPPLSKGD